MTLKNPLPSTALSAPGLRDFFSYDDDGNLCYNGISIPEAISLYGSPLEIVDTRIIKRRALEWINICSRVADKTDYPGGFSFFYASKANMSLECVHAAYQAGWHAETSSLQDLTHLMWMDEHDLLPHDIKILSNGCKISRPKGGADHNYAEMLAYLHTKGYEVTPVLDVNELSFFSSYNFDRPMPVGIRMKYGQIDSNDAYDSYVSRHGMAWGEVCRTAEQISRHASLNLEVLHAMVGAAETISVDTFVSSLLFATEKYFELKSSHPTLKYFDIGGGLPSALSGYDYEAFLTRLLRGICDQAATFGLEPPCLVWECGSYLVEESAIQIYATVQRYVNSCDGVWWYVVDGGLMVSLPDMLMVKKPFPILAGNHVNIPMVKARIGDLSCDSDGRYPGKQSAEKFVYLPDADDVLCVFAGVGSYQRMLGGAGGAHHCGIMNMGRLIVEELDNETVRTFIPGQTQDEYMSIMGFNKERIGVGSKSTGINRAAGRQKSDMLGIMGE